MAEYRNNNDEDDADDSAMEKNQEETEQKTTTPFEGFFFLKQDDTRLQKGLQFCLCVNVNFKPSHELEYSPFTQTSIQ